jgi:hypothetical protein
VKITHAKRELRPGDLKGAKGVIGVSQGTIVTTAGERLTGWWWYEGVEWHPSDDIHGPFHSQKAARDNAFANFRMMQ